MKWSELKRLAEEYGWKLARNGTRHDIYKKDGRTDVLIIERHWTEEIKPGLQKRLVKQIEQQ